ncbi:MAG TPA: transposase [Phycisphaerae bacterium]|nr:transposase [Phycisphaerae bacterium]
MNDPQRRSFTPEEKLAIVLEGLRGETEVSGVCRRHGISSNRFYKWRDRVFGGARDALSGRPGRPRGTGEVERLKEQLRRKDTIIAEITEEILKVKKGLWP